METNQDKLTQIKNALVTDDRVTMVSTIQELAGDEYETTDSVFELAKMNKQELREVLSGIYDYYLEEED
jgi:hypothetical protein